MEKKSYRIEKCDSKVQWDEFVLENGGHPMQLWGWGDARSTLGWQIDRIFIIENDTQIGSVQILSKKLARPFGLSLYIPRGPLVVSNDEAVYEQTIAYIKRNYRGVAVIVEPDDENDPKGSGWRESNINSLSPKTKILDLAKADGILLADMTADTRERIRTADAARLAIKKLGNPEDISSCYQIYKDSVSKQTGKPYREKYFHDLHDKMGEFSIIFGAYDGEILVSFIWIIISESVAVELYMGTSVNGKNLASNYGLRWEAIRRIKQWGVPKYDIGGIDESGEEEKSEFGGTITHRGTYVLPLSPFFSLWEKATRSRKRYAK